MRKNNKYPANTLLIYSNYVVFYDSKHRLHSAELPLMEGASAIAMHLILEAQTHGHVDCASKCFKTCSALTQEPIGVVSVRNIACCLRTIGVLQSGQYEPGDPMFWVFRGVQDLAYIKLINTKRITRKRKHE